MLRLAVVVYLVLATALGPAAFCCCAPKAVAAAAGLGPQKPEVPVPPAKSKAKKCPHCRDAAPPPAGQSEPAKAPPPAPKCPCKAQAVGPALPAGETDSFRIAAASALAAVTPDAAAVSFLPADGSAGDAPGDGPPVSFLSARDLLLRAHHRLRC